MATEQKTSNDVISDADKQAVKQFRERLPSAVEALGIKAKDCLAYVTSKRESADDFECLRFLRGCKMDLEAASSGWAKCMEWRFENDVDNIVRDSHKRKTELLHIVIPHSYHGYDREGRPLYYEKTGRAHLDLLLSSFSDTEALREHLYFMEYQTQRCEEASKKFGKRIETWSTVLDLKGLNTNHRKAMKVYKLFASVDQPYYPERMGFLMIVNAPWMFAPIWNVVKRWLDPVTQKKFIIVGGDPKAEMLKHIPEEHLPVEYGGGCKCERSPQCIPLLDPKLVSNFRATRKSLIMARDMSEEPAENELTEVKIPARRQHTLDVNVEGGYSVAWYFTLESHDIGFSVEFIPKKATDTSEAKSDKSDKANRIWLFSNVRVNHGTATQGSHTFKESESGVARFVWDNSFSIFTAKSVHYEVITASEEAEDIAQADSTGKGTTSAEIEAPAAAADATPAASEK